MLICVDLDGTLLDTVPANAASYRAALEELGFTVTDEYYAERCNGGHYTRFLPPLMGGAPSAADVERVATASTARMSSWPKAESKLAKLRTSIVSSVGVRFHQFSLARRRIREPADALSMV